MCLVSLLGMSSKRLEQFEIVYFSITAFLELLSVALDVRMWRSQKVKILEREMPVSIGDLYTSGMLTLLRFAWPIVLSLYVIIHRITGDPLLLTAEINDNRALVVFITVIILILECLYVSAMVFFVY